MSSASPKSTAGDDERVCSREDMEVIAESSTSAEAAQSTEPSDPDVQASEAALPDEPSLRPTFAINKSGVHGLDAHYGVIKHLYITQNQTLDEVVSTLEKVYGLTASKNMYKKKIRQWSLYKSQERVSKESMLSEVSTATQPSRNKRRNTSAKPKKGVKKDAKPLSRRHPSRDMELMLEFSAQNVARVISSPSTIKTSEEMVYAIRAYVKGCLDERLRSEVAIPDNVSGRMFIKRKRLATPNCILEFDLAMMNAFQAMQTRRPAVYGAFLEKAFRLLRDIITSNHYMAILALANFLATAIQNNAGELGQVLIRYMSNLSKTIFGTYHPHILWTQSLMLLVGSEKPKTPNIAVTVMEVVAEAIEETLGPLDDYNLIMRANMLQVVEEFSVPPPDKNLMIQKFERLLQDCVDSPYINNFPLRASQTSYGDYLRKQGDFEGAEEILITMQSKIGETNDIIQNSRLIQGVYDLAEVRASQEKHQQAEETFLFGITKANKLLGPDHGDTTGGLQRYAVFLRARGREEEAESIFKSVEKGLQPFMLQENTLAIRSERQASDTTS